MAEADEETIAEIGRRLDGLPLAIELAAARTSVLSVEEIRSNLDDRFALLTGGRRRTRGRQQTLQATVEWSYDLLEPVEQQALRALSVMPGSFGLDLAAGVLGLTTGATVNLLDGLAARSLIQSDVGSGDATGRCRLLETILTLTLSGSHDEIAEILAVPLPTQRTLGRRGSLERTLGPTLLALDGVALATIGRVADARRYLARVWDDRAEVEIPGLNCELGMALVACCVESDELDEARALLAVIGAPRFVHSLFYLFELEQRLNGTDTDDLGVRFRMTNQRVLDGAEPAFESRLADAIEGELRRLGLR